MIADIDKLSNREVNSAGYILMVAYPLPKAEEKKKTWQRHLNKIKAHSKSESTSNKSDNKPKRQEINFEPRFVLADELAGCYLISINDEKTINY